MKQETTCRKIIHVDMDCFYAAIEIRDNPQLQGKPVAVGGSEYQRGVIATCNYEARAYGVRSAMATSQAKRLCPHLILVPSQYEKYRQVSRQLHQIFQKYTDLIESLSLDEAILDVSECSLLSGSATYISIDLRQTIVQELGITASAGIASNKLLAKIASDWHKPNGQKVILPHDVHVFMQSLPVTKLYGVGKVTARKLHDLNIFTCGDLQKKEASWLSKHFGQFGLRLFELSYGIDHRLVQPYDSRQSISVEHTFEQDIPNIHRCFEQVPKLIQALHQRFKPHHHQYAINKLFVKMKFCDFTQTTAECLAQRIDPKDFYSLFEKAYQRYRKPVRLMGAGVRLTAISQCYKQQVLPFE